MLKDRVLLTSMLFVAFLHAGQAQDAGGMPAELEISLNRHGRQVPGYRVSGTIPLPLPDRDDTFVVTAKMPAYWRLDPVGSKCRLNRFVVALKVVGRRNQDRLRLALSFTAEALRPTCGDDKVIETISKVRVDTRSLLPMEYTLFVADGSNDERTVEDSSYLGNLTGKLTLHLACPVGLDVSESAPTISVLPTGKVPWPLQFDDSKTSSELSALAFTPSGVVGLTRPSRPYPPTAFLRGAIRRSAVRQGFCYWVSSIQVVFTPVEVLIASKYPAGTCEYKVIREHEMLHYEDLQSLFIRYEALVIAALQQGGFPTIERPAFVGSVTEGTGQSNMRLQNTLQPIFALMEKTLIADADARDAPQQRLLSWSQCPEWNAPPIGERSKTSFASDLDQDQIRATTTLNTDFDAGVRFVPVR